MKRSAREESGSGNLGIFKAAITKKKRNREETLNETLSISVVFFMTITMKIEYLIDKRGKKF